MKPLVVVLGTIAVAALAACSTKAKLVAQGGDCLQATDCADGLVCIPQKDGSRTCGNDLSSIQSTEDSAVPPTPDAGPREGGPADGATTDAPPPIDAADDTGAVDSATE